MKILKQLIKLHKILFIAAVLFTFLSVILNLCWNRFLAGMLDILGEAASYDSESRAGMLLAVLTPGIVIVLLHTLSEYLSSYLASYTCEIFAHEMRMGYAGYYIQSDIRTLSKFAFMMMNGPMNIPHLAVSVINTLLASFLMSRSSLLLLDVTWLFVIVQLFVNYKVVLEPAPGLKEASLKAMSQSTSAIVPLITEADAILLYDAGELMLKSCEESSRELLKSNMRIHMRNALNNVSMRLFGIGAFLLSNK